MAHGARYGESSFQVKTLGKVTAVYTVKVCRADRGLSVIYMKLDGPKESNIARTIVLCTENFCVHL